MEQITKEQLGNVAAIKRFFNNVTIQELKKLSHKDREELGDLCRAALSKA